MGHEFFPAIPDTSLVVRDGCGSFVTASYVALIARPELRCMQEGSQPVERNRDTGFHCVPSRLRRNAIKLKIKSTTTPRSNAIKLS